MPESIPPVKMIQTCTVKNRGIDSGDTWDNRNKVKSKEVKHQIKMNGRGMLTPIKRTFTLAQKESFSGLTVRVPFDVNRIIALA